MKVKFSNPHIIFQIREIPFLFPLSLGKEKCKRRFPIELICNNDGHRLRERVEIPWIKSERKWKFKKFWRKITWKWKFLVPSVFFLSEIFRRNLNSHHFWPLKWYNYYLHCYSSFIFIFESTIGNLPITMRYKFSPKIINQEISSKVIMRRAKAGRWREARWNMIPSKASTIYLKLI